ncbi:hypothetical protein [Brevundimonas balnearis]|uniref:Uncharacterized protein n=1 Tax=Brevundimonas balnearis TaxID=1572858 RepID=A0ABV6R108_9CAUL
MANAIVSLKQNRAEVRFSGPDTVSSLVASAVSARVAAETAETGAEAAQAAAEAARDTAVAATVNKLNLTGDNVGGNAATLIENIGLNARLPLIPELFGAVDTSIDPSGDYTAEIEAWFDAARTTGLPLDGRGKTYRVTAATGPVAHLHIDNVTLVESNPNTGEPRTLTLTPATAGVGSVWIGPGFKINRNGNGTAGTLGAYALLIDGVPNVHVEAEIYGNARGSGIWIRGASYVWERAYVHDMRYAHTSETDDVINGVLVNTSEDVFCNGRVERLGRIDQTSAERDRYSRGYAFSGCKRVTWNARAERVDQGVDVTGDLNSGNTQFLINGGSAKYCATYGAKFANTAVACGVTGMVIDQVGRAAVAISGPSSSLKNQTRDILVSGVVALNIGTNQLWPEPNVVLIEGSGSGRDPAGVIITGNKGTSFTGSSAFTVFDTDEIMLTGYLRIATGVRVRLTTTGTLPSGLATGTDYFIIDVPDTNRVKLASSYINALDGTPITGLSGGSGTHTLALQVDCDAAVENDTTDRVAAEPNLEWGNDWVGMVPRPSGTGGESLDLYANGARASAQSIPNAAFTTITYDAAASSSDEYAILNEATGVWSVPKSGTWEFVGRYQWAEGATTNTARIVRLESSNDGSSWSEISETVASIGATTQNMTQSINYRRRLSAGLFLRATAFQSDGAALNLTVRRSEMRFIPSA